MGIFPLYDGVREMERSALGRNYTLTFKSSSFPRIWSVVGNCLLGHQWAKPQADCGSSREPTDTHCSDTRRRVPCCWAVTSLANLFTSNLFHLDGFVGTQRPGVPYQGAKEAHDVETPSPHFTYFTFQPYLLCLASLHCHNIIKGHSYCRLCPLFLLEWSKCLPCG